MLEVEDTIVSAATKAVDGGAGVFDVADTCVTVCPDDVDDDGVVVVVWSGVTGLVVHFMAAGRAVATTRTQHTTTNPHTRRRVSTELYLDKYVVATK